MLLLECIHLLVLRFVHGTLFAVAFKILANVILQNVMPVFENLYVSRLKIV